MHPTSICFFQWWLSDDLWLDSGAHCQTKSRLCWTLCQLAKHSAVDPSNQGSSMVIGWSKERIWYLKFSKSHDIACIGAPHWIPLRSHWHLRSGSVIRWDPRLFPSRFQFCQVVAKNLAALLVTGSNMQRGIATFAIKQNIIESPSSEHHQYSLFRVLSTHLLLGSSYVVSISIISVPSPPFGLSSPLLKSLCRQDTPSS